MTLWEAIKAAWNESVEKTEAPIELPPPEPQQTLFPASNNNVHRIWLPVDTPESLGKFVDEHDMVINGYFLQRIRHAIKKNLPEIYLFDLGDSGKQVTFHRDNFEHILQTLEDFYIKKQEFETVILCRKLTTRLRVNKLIDETKR